MADLHIERVHALHLAEARKIAGVWLEQAQSEFGMQCTYTEGATEDSIAFVRSGVNGTLQVLADKFVLDAKLGFLLGAFKDRIEAEIVKNLDNLLASQPTAPEPVVKKATPKEKAPKKRVAP
jgi:putative polyhydroxyalkanoate system protein